ncbi:MAG: GDP-L-fucose synthase [Acidobacteriaceae bacterium]|nr:GDP-L-fucose synthase [Acidobacteriaceae bacterium]
MAGHRGLVGRALLRVLGAQGYDNLLLRSHDELDLRNAEATSAFFASERPEWVILAAAKVGGLGIMRSAPTEFLTDNLLIQDSVLQAARQSGVRRLLFVASSAIYPRECPQPMREEHLLTGELEPTVRPYALAKIAGIEQCWAMNRQYGTQFLALAPSNLYGPDDHFEPERSQVLASLLRKAHRAKLAGEASMEVWGSGTPRRELLFADDFAEACVHLLGLPEERWAPLVAGEVLPLLNVGVGEDDTIRELAEMVCRVVGFTGRLEFDSSKPDGSPCKLLECSGLSNLGWCSGVRLEDGLRRTYAAVRDRL